jgi:hypothetical protein
MFKGKSGHCTPLMGVLQNYPPILAWENLGNGKPNNSAEIVLDGF